MPINPSDSQYRMPTPPASSGAADGSLSGASVPAETPGTVAQLLALAKYLGKTEVHTYAFSVAANTILSLFPFIVLLLTLAQRVFHSNAMAAMVGEMMRSFLPAGGDFVMRNMVILAHPHKGTQIFSVVMLLVTSTGVFLPLEVALNDVWGVKENRNYLHNQIVSLGPRCLGRCARHHLGRPYRRSASDHDLGLFSATPTTCSSTSSASSC